MPPRELADAGEFVGREDDAARIARGGEEESAGARADRRLEVGDVGPEAVRRPQRHAHEARTRRLERRGVGRIERIEGQHFVAVAGEAERGHEQCVLGAAGQDDLVGCDALTGPALVQCGDGLTERDPSASLGIVGVAGAQCFDGAFDHRLRGRQRRVADA